MKRFVKNLIPSKLKLAAKTALGNYRLRRGVRAIFIVLDDADRPGAVGLVNRWVTEIGLAVDFNKPAGSFARLVKLS